MCTTDLRAFRVDRPPHQVEPRQVHLRAHEFATPVSVRRCGGTLGPVENVFVRCAFIMHHVGHKKKVEDEQEEAKKKREEKEEADKEAAASTVDHGNNQLTSGPAHCYDSRNGRTKEKRTNAWITKQRTREGRKEGRTANCKRASVFR